jgi:hypothetical protein
MSKSRVVTGKLVLAVTKRTLVGKKIVGFEQRPFRNGRGGFSTNPIVRLSDGTELTFQVEETEQLEYGVRIRRRLTHLHMLHLALPSTQECARCHRLIAPADRDGGRRGDAQSLVWPLQHSPNILDEYVTNEPSVYDNPPDGYARCRPRQWQP